MSGARSGIRQRRSVVVRDAKSFSALWREHAGGADEPAAVDFGALDVIAVFAGSKSTGGYSIRIGDVKRTTKGAVVAATLTKPGAGMMVAQVFTQPFAMKSVPKLPRIVSFEIREEERK